MTMLASGAGSTGCPPRRRPGGSQAARRFSRIRGREERHPALLNPVVTVDTVKRSISAGVREAEQARQRERRACCTSRSSYSHLRVGHRGNPDRTRARAFLPVHLLKNWRNSRAASMGTVTSPSSTDPTAVEFAVATTPLARREDIRGSYPGATQKGARTVLYVADDWAERHHDIHLMNGRSHRGRTPDLTDKDRTCM